jgi:hypothetical protein
MASHVKPKGRPCSHARYRLTCEEYDALVHEADDRCQLCRRAGHETGHGFLVVDHDARLGDWAVRGLLCSRCNLIIGYSGNQPPAVSAYLRSPWHARHRWPVPIKEPKVGARLTAGRRDWLRTSTGWEPQDRLGGGTLTWERLIYRHGTHAIARDNGIEGDRRYVRDTKGA